MSTLKELKDYCRKHGIKGFSKLKKNELEKVVEKHKRKIAKTPLGKYRKFLKVFDKYTVDKKTGKIWSGNLLHIVNEDIVDYGGAVPFYLEELEEKNLIYIYKKGRGYLKLPEPLYGDNKRIYFIKVQRKNLHYYFDKNGQYI